VETFPDDIPTMGNILQKPTSNACGGCTVCCKVLQVNDTPGGPKPAGISCPFINKECDGCGIYETRPLTCQSFECLYIKLARRPDIATSTALRPDISGVMFVHNPIRLYFTAHVFTEDTDAWKKPEVMEVIKRLTIEGFKVVVTFGPTPRKYMLEGDGHGGIIESIITMGEPDVNGEQSADGVKLLGKA
jgi:uncharacterized cysteine cluster protein YcgN (CxxCxxCC family)